MAVCNLSSFFFVVGTFFALIHQGTCIQCYVCKTSRNAVCGYPTPTNGASFHACPFPDDKCFHYDFNIDAERSHGQFVQRGCIRKVQQDCPKPAGDYVPRSECKICESDFCNNLGTTLKDSAGNSGGGGDGGGSSTIAPVFTLITLTILIVLKKLSVYGLF